MDRETAKQIIREAGPTWGLLRDHMMNRIFDDPDSLPSASNVNPGVSIEQAWKIYDAAVANMPQEKVIDLSMMTNELLATNIVRDFGYPLDAPRDPTLPGDDGSA